MHTYKIYTCKIYAYEWHARKRHAYEMAYRGWPSIGDIRL